jgi:hypothetical protein
MKTTNVSLVSIKSSINVSFDLLLPVVSVDLLNITFRFPYLTYQIFFGSDLNCSFSVENFSSKIGVRILFIAALNKSYLFPASFSCLD